MNAQNNNDLSFQSSQPFTPASVPSEPSQNTKKDIKMSRKISLPKIPLIAQITGFLSLLLIGAGLMTSFQLSNTSQDLSTQAAGGSAALKFEQETGTMTPGQQKNFYLVASGNPSNLQLGAAIIRLKTQDSDKIDILNIAPEPAMPIIIQQFGQEMKSGNLAQWSMVQGILPEQPFVGPKRIAAVTVLSTGKTGTAKIEIASNSEIAAYDNEANVYDKAAKFLNLTIADDTPPTSGDACVSKKADKLTMNGETVASRTELTQGSSVQRGDIIEYKITVKRKDDSTFAATVKDTIPASLEFIPGSLKIDNASATQAISDNKLDLRIGFGTIAVGIKDPRTLTYRVKVKDNAALEPITNAAQVYLNDSTTGPSTCSIALKVTDGGTTSQNAKLNLAFRVQGVTKAGIQQDVEIALRYKNVKGETKVKTYNTTMTSEDSSTPEGQPIAIFRNPAFELTDFDINDVDTGAQAQTNIDLLVKTKTSLRKNLGELTFNDDKTPVTMNGIFINDDKKLIIGDFDRSSAEQNNVIRGVDLGKMLSQFDQLTQPATGNKAIYDIDNNGVLNSGDISLMLSNLTAISVKGDEL